MFSSTKQNCLNFQKVSRKLFLVLSSSCSLKITNNPGSSFQSSDELDFFYDDERPAFSPIQTGGQMPRSWPRMPCIAGKTRVFVGHLPTWIPQRRAALWINSFLEAGVPETRRKAPFHLSAFYHHRRIQQTGRYTVGSVCLCTLHLEKEMQDTDLKAGLRNPVSDASQLCVLKQVIQSL